MSERPLEQVDLTEYFEWLDGLRLSGAVNMFGAAPHLQSYFADMSMEEAKLVSGAWMKTFDGDASADVRAERWLAQ